MLPVVWGCALDVQYHPVGWGYCQGACCIMGPAREFELAVARKTTSRSNYLAWAMLQRAALTALQYLTEKRMVPICGPISQRGPNHNPTDRFVRFVVNVICLALR